MKFIKDDTYYQNVRHDLLDLLPDGTNLNCVLEVGCGDGSTALFLRKKYHAEHIIGVDINENLKADAERKFDQVIIGDVEKINLPFEHEFFDCIIFADVLEHLYNPWAVLKKAYPLLKQKGFILASIPNVQHWSVLLKLLTGKWEYQNEGILDDTHIRFFTLYSIKKMFSENGYVIMNNKRSRGKEVFILNLLTLKLFNNLFTFRYLILASKRQMIQE